MSAPNQGRQSPEPERQTGAQQQDTPSHPGTGKIDNSQEKNSGKQDQTANLSSNPVHPLKDIAETKGGQQAIFGSSRSERRSVPAKQDQGWSGVLSDHSDVKLSVETGRAAVSTSLMADSHQEARIAPIVARRKPQDPEYAFGSPSRYLVPAMLRCASLSLKTLVFFYLSLSATVYAAQEPLGSDGQSNRRGYKKGELIPVSCLNRTIDTGEHITDAHGNLQYIPFPTCNETGQPLSFAYSTPVSQSCTVDSLPDDLYHLFEFFVHSDVPLTCRVPTYPLSQDELGIASSLPDAGGAGVDKHRWTPFTIALQGTLQLSHMHLHTNINVLFHMSEEPELKSKNKFAAADSHLIAATGYSLPNSSAAAPAEGAKIVRYEPLVLQFEVGWVDGAVLPGMKGRPIKGVVDHGVGLSLLSFFACAASAGVGAMAMLVYERRKSGRAGSYGNGLLGGNIGNGMARSSGYGGYGGYGGYTSSVGKRD